MRANSFIILLAALTTFIPRVYAGGDSSGGPPTTCVEACSKAGAKGYLVDEVGSTVICEFDFAQIEEFTLCRAMDRGAGTQQATEAFLHTHSGAHPPYAKPSDAESFCKSLGAKIHVYPVTLKPDDHVTMCEFSDGSQIEEWTLYWGLVTAYNRDLEKVLIKSDR